MQQRFQRYYQFLSTKVRVAFYGLNANNVQGCICGDLQEGSVETFRAHTGTIFSVSGESPLVGSFYGHCSFSTLIINFSVEASHTSQLNNTPLFYFRAILAHICLLNNSPPSTVPASIS